MATTKKLSQAQVKQRNDAIRDYLKKDKTRLFENYAETAKAFDTTPESVRHIAKALRVTLNVNREDIHPKVEFKIDEQVMVRRENAQIKTLKKQLEMAVNDYQQISDALDVALNIKTQDVSGMNIPTILENKKITDEATAIIQLSDCHFGKLIVPSTVNGLNEFNEMIARDRMDKFTENCIKLINKERHATKIDNLVFILGGDFIENSQLHQGSEMTTTMSPMEEVLFARELIHKSIKTIATNGNFKKIMIPCVRGNHPRITKKMIASVDYRMNYETILYNVLKEDFKSKEFEWVIPDSEVCEIQVYGKMLRIVHGHQIKSNGGVGGITIPLNKYIMGMDQTNKAFYNFVHHFHNLSYPPGTNTTINGSLVGYDPFAMSIRAKYEEPVQSFQLLDKNKGMTIKCPIFCK